MMRFQRCMYVFDHHPGELLAAYAGRPTLKRRSGRSALHRNDNFAHKSFRSLVEPHFAIQVFNHFCRQVRAKTLTLRLNDWRAAPLCPAEYERSVCRTPKDTCRFPGVGRARPSAAAS